MLLIYSPTIFAEEESMLRTILQQLRPFTLTFLIFMYMRICMPRVKAFQQLVSSILFILGSIVIIFSTWGIISAINSSLIDFSLNLMQTQTIATPIIIFIEAIVATVITQKRIMGSFEFSKGVQIFSLCCLALLIVLYSRANDVIKMLESENWLYIKNSYTLTFAVTAVTCGAMLILLATIRNTQKKKEQLEIENYYYNMRQKSLSSFNEIYKELRVLRHDFHNHVLALRAIAEENDHKKLEEYLDVIDPIYTRTNTIVQTSNSIFDAILNATNVYAIKNNIKMEMNVRLPESLPLNAIEITSLLGNLLDNATEACDRVKEKISSISVFLRVNIGSQSGNLYIRVENSALEPNLRKKRYITSKNSQNHGFGIGQIDYIVSSHGGRTYREYEGGIFSTTIFIPLDISKKSKLR
jgi:hypothetical protein